MALNKEQKKKILEKCDATLINTGSNKVQFNLLTANIEILSYHIKNHPGDFQAKRSLMIKRHQLKMIKRNV
ncbi:MAG: 30S ribosomal protein S15 [Pigeon pea little leaf phytoplasma]|uniref:30S ribosomal protein S15 n=1 Tax=Candidatus Phytoplasma fabacearum TaxID=2982628 RepID=A0ABU8ZT40_9MOLU|nr:30S ribosomal protein S15 ['Bituminaria bituminosa' little leaf phytoplasma]MDV3148932.1 30S ribosomal protein S15 [Pigeon pea little leaf phytoplasma]MDO7983603.1 30S ribosomal protein S15 ['Bituminaria bituminosa' little leaf phytoplasma]MDO8023758.1 30S ribosomal protein S15 ['Bituminaria bituminosa' little leaf phytoplasma]MDO8030423.1 30S ribosomal protein S15 ['Bituminaria bituminosa' little leaf phytoplasma]MDV3153945.1 30S ribosomal protein S15 [Pigeon pea little leaf phytoplasma]